ncbi:hypothetical protein [Citrobacter portucalensis]|uniref:T6SS immunity protein Tli3 family protein n=1 Tax=Citrobacter portucalensis TaxID=1639133 RepID=UPI0039FCA4B5
MKPGITIRVIIGAVSLFSITACTKKIPTQVIYRYDDNRYLELKGFDCEGALWYHDTRRNIHKELVDGVYSTYQIFSGVYIHPSDKYILIPRWEPGAYKISKDYGQTWQVATYMAPFPALERNSDGVMRDSPEGKEIKRVVVVNNQAFISTAQDHLYMSSYPFDDPRLAPGGPGIDYQYFIPQNSTYLCLSGSQGHIKYLKITDKHGRSQNIWPLSRRWRETQMVLCETILKEKK